MNSEKDGDITCHRCGNCCHVDVAAYVSLEDIQRWEKEGRHDVLAHVHDNDGTDKGLAKPEEHGRQRELQSEE